MSANLENSVVTTELEKSQYSFNPKERQCQRMFKQMNIFTYSTYKQGYAQNPSS